MSEADELKRMGAKAQKNSGRGKVAKGDGILDARWLVDVKEYPKGFTVSLDAWAKICTDAMRAGNYEPLLNIVIGEGLNKVRLFVLSEDEFDWFRTLLAEREK